MTAVLVGSPTEVGVHIDILCPFAYQASRWLREVRDRTGLVVSWRFFSLEEANLRPGSKHPWEREWTYGWSLMRVAALLRRMDPALCDRWYECAGRALHEHGRKSHRPEVARELLAEIGLSPDLLDQALADPTTHDEILTEHQRVIGLGGFGAPTMIFPDGQVLFGPVLVDPPTGDRALELWQTVTALLRFPEVFEIQRPRGPEQQRRIATVLDPYLQARDWVSINRGEILDFTPPPLERETKAGVS